jgi:hypothetical protein
MAGIDRLLRETLSWWRVRAMRPVLSALLPHLPLSPPRTATVAYELARLRALSGADSRAVAGLTRAADRGLWWAPELMASDSAFRAISGQEEFQAVLKRSALQRRTAQRPAPEVVVIEPPGRPRALLVVLHSRNGTAHTVAGDWRYATRLGYRLVVPDSGQRFGMDTFCWDDNEEAAHRVENVVGLHPSLPVVVAGFSQGAALAIWLIVSGKIPSTRFIAVNPGFVTSPPLDPLLTAASSRPVMGSFIVGELDPDLAEASRVYAGMSRAGLDVGLTTLAGLGHDMPRPFGPHLVRVLDELAVP